MDVLQKDRQNKKIKRYYVTYEEGDEELSEDEERHVQQDQEAHGFQWFSAFFETQSHT